MNDAALIPTMPDARHCPQCGTPLPTGALAGLCPACLLQQGAADTATDGKQPPFVPPTVEEIAQLFPQLEILGLLGKGGMGAVYKARQPALDRLVALKILPATSGSEAGFAERFAREARALARLSHPHIVTLFEFGSVVGQASRLSPSSANGQVGETPQGAVPHKSETDATPVLLFYFLMEFVDGVNLRQLQRSGRLGPREAL
jgi:serine/threonine protein kinase